MRRLAVLRPLAMLLALAVAAPPAAARQPAPELVVLVHGLGRTPLSMLPLEWTLERAGYQVLNWGYDSVSDDVPRLGARLAADARAEAERRGAGAVHFVGHSLGGILIRWALAHDPPPAVGRVVMLAPPNQGSHEADRFAPWLGWLLRPLPELRTGEAGVPADLPPPGEVEVGIVAARGDGKVSLEETRLPGAREHVSVAGGHTWIMARGDVRRLVLRFLETGAFLPPAPQPSRAAAAPLPPLPLRYQ